MASGNSEVHKSSHTRARLLEAIDKYHLKQVDIARETGIHHSTLSLWLQDKAKGHKTNIEEALEKYLSKLMSNRPRITSTHITKFHSLKGFKEEDPIPMTTDINPAESSLVPVKLDIELEGKQMRDSFIWDKNEPYITLDYFAKILAEEHNLAQSFEPEIVKYFF